MEVKKEIYVDQHDVVKIIRSFLENKGLILNDDEPKIIGECKFIFSTIPEDFENIIFDANFENFREKLLETPLGLLGLSNKTFNALNTADNRGDWRYEKRFSTLGEILNAYKDRSIEKKWGVGILIKSEIETLLIKKNLISDEECWVKKSKLKPS